VLQKVVKRVRGTTPKYDVAKGTLLTVDPCASLDDSAAKEAAPAAKKRAIGLHSCSWRFRPKFAPRPPARCHSDRR
jgi:hypothetical protein